MIFFFQEQDYLILSKYYPCCHHIYELVLESVFEDKMSQPTSSQNVPLFKIFNCRIYRIDVYADVKR